MGKELTPEQIAKIIISIVLIFGIIVIALGSLIILKERNRINTQPLNKQTRDTGGKEHSPCYTDKSVEGISQLSANQNHSQGERANKTASNKVCCHASQSISNKRDMGNPDISDKDTKAKEEKK